jgi:hypothetical protein
VSKQDLGFTLTKHLEGHLRVTQSPASIVRAIRQHIPAVRSACRSSSKPPLEDWLPPLKSTVSFLRQTDGRSKGSSLWSFMAAVAER